MGVNTVFDSYTAPLMTKRIKEFKCNLKSSRATFQVHIARQSIARAAGGSDSRTF
jgi:hypothetical protein